MTLSHPTNNISVWRIPRQGDKRGGFPNPFLDTSSFAMPNNIKEMFRWAEHIYLYNGIVSQCIERIVKYPITEITYDEETTEVQELYSEFFEKTTNVKDHIITCGIDLFVYGNSFTSVFLPFIRVLKCKKCRLETPVEKVSDLKFDNYKYRGKCKCGNTGLFESIDRRSLREEDTNYVRWDPHNIEISYNPVTGKYQYFYKIPQEVKRRVQQGDLHLINGLPWSFIEAIEKNQMIKFNRDSIYHMKQPSLAGLGIEWGLPPVLRTFKLHYYVAILRRANEAIAQDYLVPIRVFFPQGSHSVQDPSSQLSMVRYKKFLQDMVKKHRTDPADAYFSPIPVGYQALGGEGKALSVNQEINIANEEIMASMGFPRELFYGTMSVQAAPMALRVFENTFSFYINAINRYIRWISTKIGTYFDWDEVTPKFAPVTMVDDTERKAILMQLAGTQLISRDTLLQTLGTSVKSETEKQFDEQRIMQEAQKEFEEKSQADAMNEAGGQAQATSLGSLDAQAQQTAQMWLQMPEGQRRSEMYRIAQYNPSLHAMAKTYMDRMRNMMRTDAYNQAQQQGMM